MGNIIHPNWDEKRRPHVVTRTYIGYGYTIDTYSDGSQVLVKDKTYKEIPLGKCTEFDDNGYPRWQELVKRTLGDSLRGSLIDELGILKEDNKDEKS